MDWRSHAERLASGVAHPVSRWRTVIAPSRGIVQMLRHANVYDGADILDVGTGSGYGCAVLTQRLGGQHVTSVDVDAYLTKVAAERLDSIGRGRW